MTTALTISQKDIEHRIFTIRGIQVMIDRDLAELYGVETKRLNEQVRRNLDRFPSTFRFRLTKRERDELVANCDRFASMKHASALPYAFTEQGVVMLSAVLRSETAVRVSVQIMQAFVEMRKLLLGHAVLFQRLDNVELKQLEADQKFEKIFKALESASPPDKGLFFDGQVFDAWKFVSDLVRKAKRSIVLIDNYIDDTVLSLFTKRWKNVSVLIYTRNITRQLRTDLEKHNAQYDPLEIRELKEAHDRFLILDGTELYHFGASLKDLGKTWFAFSKMDIESVGLLNRLKSGR